MTTKAMRQRNTDHWRTVAETNIALGATMEQACRAAFAVIADKPTFPRVRFDYKGVRYVLQVRLVPSYNRPPGAPLGWKGWTHGMKQPFFLPKEDK